jgi:hypothetical protein
MDTMDTMVSSVGGQAQALLTCAALAVARRRSACRASRPRARAWMAATALIVASLLSEQRCLACHPRSRACSTVAASSAARWAVPPSWRRWLTST